MAIFSRRKDTPDGAAEPGEARIAAVDTVAEIRPGRRRTVGQLLRETRESYGSDIARVASALRIRAAYLEAIEEGHYDRLPGPVYALGFVRAYAVHLGLDGEEAVRRFKLEAEGFEGQRDLSFPVPLTERSIPGGAMVLAAVILAVCAYGIWYYLSSTAGPRPERVAAVPSELAKPTPPVVPHPAAGAASVVAPAAAPASAGPAAAAAVPPSASAPAAAPPPTPSAPPPAAASAPPVATAAAPPTPAAQAAATAPAAPSPAPAPATAEDTVPEPPEPSPPAGAGEQSPPPVPSPPAQTAALPSAPADASSAEQGHVYGLANGETRIMVRATGDSWIQVRDRDHKPIFTRELHAGDTYHVPNEPGITMRTGRASSLVITVDGRSTPSLGGTLRPNVYLDPERLLAGTAVAE
jgi:cytoskeleton protein RodZ